MLIDNEAVRACTIKASSPSPTMRALARVIGDLEVSFPSMTWYERVCSFSNPSDLPSRGNVRQALVDYFLEDRGMIQGSDDLVDLVLQLTDEPYQVASTISGAKT